MANKTTRKQAQKQLLLSNATRITDIDNSWLVKYGGFSKRAVKRAQTAQKAQKAINPFKEPQKCQIDKGEPQFSSSYPEEPQISEPVEITPEIEAFLTQEWRNIAQYRFRLQKLVRWLNRGGLYLDYDRETQTTLVKAYEGLNEPYNENSVKLCLWNSHSGEFIRFATNGTNYFEIMAKGHHRFAKNGKAVQIVPYRHAEGQKMPITKTVIEKGGKAKISSKIVGFKRWHMMKSVYPKTKGKSWGVPQKSRAKRRLGQTKTVSARYVKVGQNGRLKIQKRLINGRFAGGI